MNTPVLNIGGPFFEWLFLQVPAIALLVLFAYMSFQIASWMRTRFKEEMKGMTRELKEAMKDMKTELKADTAQLRAELKTDTSQLREEMNSGYNRLREEMNSGYTRLREEMNSGYSRLREEIKEVKTELKSETAQLREEVKTEMKANTSQLREDMNLGYNRVREEMNSGYARLWEGMDSGHARLREDIKELKTDVKSDSTHFKQEMKELHNDLKALGLRVSHNEVAFNNLTAFLEEKEIIPVKTLKAMSPWDFTEEGLKLLTDCGGKSYVDCHLEEFIDDVRQKNFRSGYDIERYCIRLIESRSGDDGFLYIRDFIYNSPLYEMDDKTISRLNLHSICYIMGIYLRKKYLEKYPLATTTLSPD